METVFNTVIPASWMLMLVWLVIRLVHGRIKEHSKHRKTLIEKLVANQLEMFEVMAVLMIVGMLVMAWSVGVVTGAEVERIMGLLLTILFIIIVR